MSRFDWCARGQHKACRREGEVLRSSGGKGAAKELVKVFCTCDEARCKCAKNPRPEGVQAPTDSV